MPITLLITFLKRILMCGRPSNVLAKINKIYISDVFILCLQCLLTCEQDLFSPILLHSCSVNHQWKSWYEQHHLVVLPLSKLNPLDWIVTWFWSSPVTDFNKFITTGSHPFLCIPIVPQASILYWVFSIVETLVLNFRHQEVVFPWGSPSTWIFSRDTINFPCHSEIWIQI